MPLIVTINDLLINVLNINLTLISLAPRRPAAGRVNVKTVGPALPQFLAGGIMGALLRGPQDLIFKIAMDSKLFG